MGFRSYLVEVNGSRYRRNRKHLRTTAEQLPVQTELSDAEESSDETTDELQSWQKLCGHVKPLLHDQIFFVKFHCKLGAFDKFTFNKPLTHEICQRKFGRVKGA